MLGVKPLDKFQEAGWLKLFFMSIGFLIVAAVLLPLLGVITAIGYLHDKPLKVYRAIARYFAGGKV